MVSVVADPGENLANHGSDRIEVKEHLIRVCLVHRTAVPEILQDLGQYGPHS